MKKALAILLALLVISAGCSGPQESAPDVINITINNNTSAAQQPNPVQKSTSSAPAPKLKLLWKYKAGDAVYGASAAGDRYVFASWDGHVYSLDKNGSLLWKRRLVGSAEDAAASADGSYAAATGHLFPNGALYFFQDGKLLWQTAISNYVKGVDVSQDGSFIALASGDGKVSRYNKNGTLGWSFQTGKSAWGVWDVAISPDSRYLAAACDDTYLYLLDINGKLLWKKSQGKDSYLYGAAVSSNAERVAAASQNGYVYVYGKNGTLLWKYKTGATNYGVALSSNGEYVAIASWDKNLYLLDEKGALIQKHALDSEANRAAFSQERYLALGTKLGYAYVFEIER